jgi:hypothetical protein
MPDDLLSRARLDIRDGVIHYGLYQQDGTMQAMTCRDTTSNRMFVSWVKQHDRLAPECQMSDNQGGE